jgi:hypothetical protein
LCGLLQRVVRTDSSRNFWHHLLLIGFALPIGFAFITTAVDLVSVYLFMDYPSKFSARKNFILAPAGDACDM